MLGLIGHGCCSADETPVGIWRTYDDTDGQVASLVQIEEKNGLLEGRVLKILPRKDVDKYDV